MSLGKLNDDEIPEQTAAPGGVRGKYFESYRQGTNVVLLDPDVAEAFRSSESVNAALRHFLAEQGVPGIRGGQRRQPPDPPWRHPCSHRSERRREDHRFQPADSIPFGDVRLR